MTVVSEWPYHVWEGKQRTQEQYPGVYQGVPGLLVDVLIGSESQGFDLVGVVMLFAALGHFKNVQAGVLREN